MHNPSNPVEPKVPIVQPGALPQHTILLQEARTEAEQLRAELASLKILMAKQSAEFRTLQEQGQGAQKRDQERGIELQNIRSELMASQGERDQLRRRNIELEGQMETLANTTQLVTEIQTLRTSFQQIMSNLKDLTTDMTLIKKAMHVPVNKPTLQKTTLSESSRSRLPGENVTPDSTGRIVIQEGDTLWKLAIRHHVSVDQLKAWNDLSSDLIMTGLPLRVIPPEIPQNPQAHLEAETAQSPVVIPTQSEAETGPPNHQTNQSEPEGNPVQSETRNLLSVSTP